MKLNERNGFISSRKSWEKKNNKPFDNIIVHQLLFKKHKKKKKDAERPLKLEEKKKRRAHIHFALCVLFE